MDFLSVEHLSLGPGIVTPVRLWRFKPSVQDGEWDDEITAACPWCGCRFVVDESVLSTIHLINRDRALSPDQSPCLDLSEEAWNDPSLLQQCPSCAGALKCNPFVADSCMQTWRTLYAPPVETPLQGPDFRLVSTLAVCRGNLTSVALSADGQVVASTGGWALESGLAAGATRRDGTCTVRVWDAVSGVELSAVSGHEATVRALAFSPDGQQLASGGGDCRIKLRALPDGRELHDLTVKSQVLSVAFSPDGKFLASGHLYNMNTGDDCAIALWDTATGLVARDVACFRDTYSVHVVTFSHDGRHIAAGCESNIKIWQVESGREMSTLRGENRVCCLAFSPDGRYIASGDAGTTVKLWDFETLRETAAMRGHVGEITSVAFTHDSRHLITGSSDSTIRFWEVPTGRKAGVLDGDSSEGYGPGFIVGLRLSRNGEWLAAARTDGAVKIWQRCD